MIRREPGLVNSDDLDALWRPCRDQESDVPFEPILDISQIDSQATFSEADTCCLGDLVCVAKSSRDRNDLRAYIVDRGNDVDTPRGSHRGRRERGARAHGEGQKEQSPAGAEARETEADEEGCGPRPVGPEAIRRCCRRGPRRARSQGQRPATDEMRRSPSRWRPCRGARPSAGRGCRSWPRRGPS